MKFVIAKKGVRPSNIKVTIREKTSVVSFSAGFLRLYNMNKENSRYVRQAYSVKDNEIAFEFNSENDDSGEMLKVSYNHSGSTAYFPIKPILISFSLEIEQISGSYWPNAIIAQTKIDGFKKEGFILKVNKRETPDKRK